MNFPGWNFENDAFVTNQKKPMGCVSSSITIKAENMVVLSILFALIIIPSGKFYRSDQELVELIWQNGQVVMHSQTQNTVQLCIDLGISLWTGLPPEPLLPRKRPHWPCVCQNCEAES